jgi:hypothetical protein
MKLTPFYLAAIAPLAVASCSGEFLGHVTVLALTLGIFFGTLSLGRRSAAVVAVAEQTAGEASKA